MSGGVLGKRGNLVWVRVIGSPKGVMAGAGCWARFFWRWAETPFTIEISRCSCWLSRWWSSEVRESMVGCDSTRSQGEGFCFAWTAPSGMRQKFILAPTWRERSARSRNTGQRLRYLRLLGIVLDLCKLEMVSRNRNGLVYSLMVTIVRKLTMGNVMCQGVTRSLPDHPPAPALIASKNWLP